MEIHCAAVLTSVVLALLAELTAVLPNEAATGME